MYNGLRSGLIRHFIDLFRLEYMRLTGQVRSMLEEWIMSDADRVGTKDRAHPTRLGLHPSLPCYSLRVRWLFLIYLALIIPNQIALIRWPTI